MNSAELAALVDHVILPTTLQQRCDALGISICSPAFDELCKAFAHRIGLGDVWYLIMYPFPLSADNCQKHPWVRRLLLRPRLREEEWAELEAKLQRSENKYVFKAAVKEARKHLNGAAVSDEALIALAAMLCGAPGHRTTVLAKYQEEHGMPYKMKRLRKLMVTCPWLRIVFPHQFMPLTPVTPDIHQPIEHRVHELKMDLGAAIWWLLKDGDDPALLQLARTYQERIIESAKQRSGEKGKRAIVGSINRMLALVQILRTKAGEVDVVVRTRLMPDGTEDCTFELVEGTGGGWASNRYS